MTKFHYKAARHSGEVFEGVVEVADRFSVYDEVRKNEGVVLSIDEVGAGFNIDVAKYLAIFGRIKTSEKIIFAHNLSAMMGAGLSLSRALSVLERQTRNKKFKSVIGAIDERIKKGESLHGAMGAFPNVFSRLFTSMVKAGEESGKLSGSLKVVADQVERVNIRGAMMYPGIILCAMGLIGVAMLIYVVPTIADTFKSFKVDLPFTTRIVIAVSDAFVNHFVLFGVGFLLFIAGMVAFLKVPRGQRVRDYLLLRLPVVGTIVRETNSARTARTLSSLLSSGVEVIAAIGITADVVQNSYFRAVLTEAAEQVQKGKQMGSIFAAHENLYPPLVGELIAVGEETGDLSSMLLEVATFYENEVEQKTKNLSTIIEPLLMIFIGIAVGFFALSIISPIYSLSNAI